MEHSVKLDLIKQEYFKLQDFYEDFDKRIQTIKGWSITVALAAIAAGLNYKNEYLGLFAAISSFVFWIIDATWKSFQYHYRPRIAEIEEKMRAEDITDIKPLQIYASWGDSYRQKKYTPIKLFSYSIVYIPHLPIVLIGLAFFLFQHYHIISFWKNG
jgi:hypothetical protein